jgi:outer membrane protein assembly factor BamB
MKKIQNKTMTTLITFILMLTIMATSVLVALPSANAHTPAWTIPTYAYITVNPSPVGVGQTVAVVMWLNIMPPTAAGVGGDRWRDLKLEITKPDQSKVTLGPFVTDAVGSAYASYTPDETGIYSLLFKFPGQVCSLNGPSGIPGSTSDYINDTYLASNATATLIVQQEPIDSPIVYPLPTEYWTQPIEGQNNEWYTIASNWLGGSQIVGRVQLNGIAPNSPHVMWSKPISFGGVAGVNTTLAAGMTFYSGTQYEVKFANSIIMNGRIYYGLPRGNDVAGGGYSCLDLRTGDELWRQNYTTNPTFGQLYDYESLNQHGVVPNGYLWTSNFANAYDAFNGYWLFSMTGVPTGTEVYGPNGEITRYVLNYAGRWLALWNNTAGHDLTGATSSTDYTSTSYNQWRPIGKTVNMSQAYSWNVTIPSLPGLGAPTIIKVIPDDVVFGRSTTMQNAGSTASGVWGTPDPYTLWAISLKPQSRGSLLWIKNFAAPANNLTMLVGPVDDKTGVFTLEYRETMQWFGYDIHTGNQLWGPTASESTWNFYAGTSGSLTANTVADGHLYSTGYSGTLFCYDLNDGSLLWNYTAPAGFATAYGAYPMLIGAVADGKIYLFTSEHSANAPPYVGAKVRCINASTGTEMWTLADWSHSNTMAVADGYLVYSNLYDMQIYSVGKGPSALTSIASPKTSVTGDSVLIEGMVTDISAGTKQNQQAARFPSGVPAVSDESMSAWMEYVYMQKPKPTDTKGVDVTLNVIDANGNYRPIGSTTSDANGFYSFEWQPDIAGKYTVIASFEGSQSYWPSHAETAFIVSDAASTPTQQPIVASPPTELYFALSTAAIIIAIAIGFAVTIFVIRKRP